MLIVIIVGTAIINLAEASVGDNSIINERCLRECDIDNCDEEGNFIDSEKTGPALELMQWSCSDECHYSCMWETIEAFAKRGQGIPQFHGKWPFIRFLGLQEPASVLFSMMNFYAHLKCLLKFRKDVRADSPMYWIWHLYCFVNLNGWIWSTIFHARDFPHTEFLDYAGGFAIILITCYCMIMRLLKDIPRFMRIIITVFFMVFFSNHVAYLKLGQFDYAYNMQVNILVGTFSGICWVAWCIYNRHRQPYVYKCALFAALSGVTLLFEVIDKPPFFYILDFHAIWHLSTVPLVFIWYSFVTDDCKYLRKQMAVDEKVLKGT